MGQISLRMAIIWFICSEVLFFFRFFFHASLRVVAETRYAWPPARVLVLDPSSVPLLNTVLLLRFSITDSAYRSVFFIATRFHRFHVLVGSAFLVVCLVRMVRRQLNASRHVRYECAVWYWHFVDTVWIYLYCLVY